MFGYKFLLSVLSLSVLYRETCQASLWIVQSELGQDVADKSSHQTLLSELAKKSPRELGYHLLTEHYVLATGNEFYGLSGVDAVNDEQHAQARALVALSEKLHAVRKVNSAVHEATLYAAEQVKNSGDIKNAMAVVYEKAESLLKNDPELFNEYNGLKVEAKKQVTGAGHKVFYGLVPATLEEAKKVIYESVNLPLSKEALANAAFFNQTQRRGAAVDKETLTLAKAALKLANNPQKRNAIEAVYEASLHETAKNAKDITYDGTEHHFEDYVTNLVAELAKTLEAKVKSDPSLSADFQAAKQEVSS